jgi:RNA polymerase sigma factor for flagellar operon FliA
LVVQAIEELPERERQVLSLYYFEELTMKEIGALMGVGESRVSQMHSMAVIKLRATMAASGTSHSQTGQAAAGSAST